jgi:hypothetical protein
VIAEFARDILTKFSFWGAGRQQFHSQDEKSIKTHIPHPKLSQREITERKNQSEHKNKHKERKKAFEKQ